MFAGDPTGRKDLVGHQVGFYPTVRGVIDVKRKPQTAEKPHKDKALKDNPQKRKTP